MKPKILCVDDEPFILHALERLLRDDFEVVTTTSPEEALGLLEGCAVVLSDYRMPEMNGVEFLREVRILSPLSSRVILSGQIDLQQISMAINHADIHKFILKPWEGDYLIVQLLESLQMHRTLREKAHFEHLAITDPVTQLTNHRFFQDQLRHELRVAEENGRELSLVIFDVDLFKSFNDRFGHPEGDRLLMHVASQLRTQTEGDGFVSRYGGEEFTLILPGMGGLEAYRFADRVRAHFEKAPIAGPLSSPAYITLSAGLASFPLNATSAPELIECADRALYQAKRQGRNQVAVAGTRQPAGPSID